MIIANNKLLVIVKIIRLGKKMAKDTIIILLYPNQSARLPPISAANAPIAK